MRAAAVADPAVSDVADIGTTRFAVRFSPNALRWAGNGLLHATRRALRFTARRAGLLGYALPRETLLVPVARVTSVYREAEVIRLQFRREPSDEPVSLEFSAETGGLAASIVGYLPSAQTVELDRSPRPRGPSVSMRRAGLWIYVLPLILAGLVAVVLWLRSEARRTDQVSIEAAEALVVLPSQPLVEPQRISAEQLSELRVELRDAGARTAQLKERFGLELRQLMEGKLTQSYFALMLNRDLIPQWRKEEAERARRAATAATSARALGLLNESADQWSRALGTYSAGLRAQDPTMVLEAFELLRVAEEFEQQAYALLRDAEKRSASEGDAQP